MRLITDTLRSSLQAKCLHILTHLQQRVDIDVASETCIPGSSGICSTSHPLYLALCTQFGFLGQAFYLSVLRS